MSSANVAPDCACALDCAALFSARRVPAKAFCSVASRLIGAFARSLVSKPVISSCAWYTASFTSCAACCSNTVGSGRSPTGIYSLLANNDDDDGYCLAISTCSPRLPRRELTLSTT